VAASVPPGVADLLLALSIIGSLGTSHDGGATWEHDFDLTYRKASRD
jgi:hypothetical protein